MSGWRWIAAALALAGYALLSHVLMVLAGDKPWAVAALLGPAVLALGALALQQRHLPTVLSCAVALTLLAWIGASGRAPSIHRLYLLQHAGIHLALGCAFALTLRRGATPLVTALAASAGGSTTPALASYTRRVTVLWVGYFFAMVALSLSLFAWAPWWVWSLLANLATPLAIAALFVGEYWLRYRLHPEFERTTMLQALRAYRRVSPTGRRP